MIRRLNYTGRRKIPREFIRISLYRNGSVSEFDAFIRTEKLDLPLTARVFVEAYHKSDWMRFYFGTVGEPTIPQDRRLTNFYDGARILFRVKFVSTGGDTGKILAEADRLTPLSADDDSERDPLLPERTVGGMGEQLWRVSWSDGWPVLELNKGEPEIKHLLTADPRFKWLVLPEVLRTILARILTEEMDEEEDSGETASKRWLDFAESLYPQPPPKAADRDADLIEDWVNEVVSAFCRRHNALGHWRASVRPEDLFQSA